MALARFDADDKTIRELLNASGVGYYIPIYQRPYSWTTENADRLIDDCVDGLVRFCETGKSSSFLGTIIIVDDSDTLYPAPDDKPSTVMQVIDGQQRIATLLVLAGELRRAIERAASEAEASEIYPIDRIRRTVSFQLEQALRFRLVDGDRSELPRMIRGLEDRWSIDSPDYKSDIAKYLYSFDPVTGPTAVLEGKAFKKLIATVGERLQDMDGGLFRGRGPVDLDETKWRELFGQDYVESAESLEGRHLRELLIFSAYMMNRVQVVSVETDDEETAFAVFEPLNTTGQPLTAFETFRPLVVQRQGGQNVYVNSPAHFEIEKFEHLVNDLDVDEVGKRTRRAVSTFALSDTGQSLGERLAHQRTYLRRYEVLNDDQGSVFLEGLGNTAKILGQTWYEDSPLSGSSQETQVALRALVASNHTIPQALLVRSFEELTDTDPLDRDVIIQQIAAFWVLWRLSRSTTGNIDAQHRAIMAGDVLPSGHSVGPYCRRPREGDSRAPVGEELSVSFRALLEERGDIGSKVEWMQRASSLLHGSHGNKALLRYALLGAYHDAIVEDPPDFIGPGVAGSSTVLTTEWYTDELTIEHIAPQKLQSGDVTYEGTIYTEGLVDRLGNLTLVPREENSVMRNQSWTKKAEYFKVFAEKDPSTRNRLIEDFDPPLKDSTARMLSSGYLPFCEDLARVQGDTWTAELLRRRGEQLAARIWEHFGPILGL